MIAALHFTTGDVTAAVAAFLLVMSLWTAALIIWRLRRRVQRGKLRQRLEILDAQGDHTRTLRLWYEGKESATTVPGKDLPWLSARHLAGLCQDAGWTAPVSSIVLMLAGVMAAVFMLLLVISGRTLVGCVGAAAVAMVFWIYLNRRISVRAALFERQLVDALDLASRSLRAGHPLVGAFQLIAEEVPPPVGAFFSEICQQQALGVSLERAVAQSILGHSSPDVKFFGTSVILQLRSGGNLADMMERLAYIIRDRISLNRRVRVLTAQAQFSKNILAAMPVVFFVLMTIINPRYTEPLYTTGVGQVMLGLAAILVVLGVYLMNRMMVLRF
jgi:tight adherence protein B